MALFDFLRGLGSGSGDETEKVQSTAVSEYEDDEEDYDDGERLSVYDAAEIWLSNGMDEDYMFGYDEDELRDAL